MLRALFLLSFTFFLHAQDFVEFDYELDAYYSNVSAFIDLDRDGVVEDGSDMDEDELYTDLVLHTFDPNIFLVEAALHPMPLAGIYWRKEHESAYEKSEIKDFNLARAITAGFEEPYSLSLFMGRMVVFKNSEDGRIGKNRAYMGYLVSFGDHSIKENVSHEDNWVNFEFKLKGTREKAERDLDWSFRLGTRWHDNKDFVNTYYVAARRSSIDYYKSEWSFIYNTAFESLLECSAESFKLTQAQLIIEKKWPVGWSDKLSFGLGIGYLYNSSRRYNGALEDEGIDNHQLIFRPNLKW